jgi:hypothetical protein
LVDSFDEAIVCVGSFVKAGKTFKTLVLHDLQSDAVLGSKLFQLRHHAVRDIRDT